MALAPLLAAGASMALAGPVVSEGASVAPRPLVPITGPLAASLPVQPPLPAGNLALGAALPTPAPGVLAQPSPNADSPGALAAARELGRLAELAPAQALSRGFDGTTDRLWSDLEAQALEAAGLSGAPAPEAWRLATARLLKDRPGTALHEALGAGLARARGAGEEQAKAASTLLSPGSFEAVPTPKGAHRSVWHAGSVWFATPEGVYELGGDSRPRLRREGAANWLASVRGRLLLAAPDGLWERDGDGWRRLFGGGGSKPSDAALSVGEAGGRLWASFESGLYSTELEPPRLGWLRRGWEAARARVTGERPGARWRRELDRVIPFKGVVAHQGRLFGAGAFGLWERTAKGWRVLVESHLGSFGLASFEGALYAALPDSEATARVGILRGGRWSYETVAEVGPVSEFHEVSGVLVAVTPNGLYGRMPGGWTLAWRRRDRVVQQYLDAGGRDWILTAGTAWREKAGPRGVPDDWRERLEADLARELERSVPAATAAPEAPDSLDDESGRSLF